MNKLTRGSSFRFWNGSHPYHMESTTTRSRRLGHPTHVSGCCKTRDSVNGRIPVHPKFYGFKVLVSIPSWVHNSVHGLVILTVLASAGKTFLTSKVIDHIQSLLRSSPNQEGFAFFYCNQNGKERRELPPVLQSCTRQLSTATRYPGDIRKSLRDLYYERRRGASDLDSEACRKQLLEVVSLYPKTTLVLDALDECNPESCGSLVDTINFLLAESKRPLKVFISSRPDPDIQDQFRSRPSIEVQATNNQADIEKFVNEEIAKHPRWSKMSLSLKGKIINTLLTGSKGM